MAAKLFIATLLTAHFITARCISSKEFDDIVNGVRQRYHKIVAHEKAYKSARCFMPDTDECNATAYPNVHVVLYRWHYSPVDQACRPLYMPHSQRILCPAMNNLPLTKKECEDLCGEPCTVVYGNKKTEPGIYMINEYCHIPVPEGAPHPSYTRCCPRGYKYPETTPVPETPKQPTTAFPIGAIIVDLKPRRGNKTR